MPPNGLPLSRAGLWGLLTDELGAEDEAFRDALVDLKTPSGTVEPGSIQAPCPLACERWARVTTLP
jgi:hypothetical protein